MPHIDLKSNTFGRETKNYEQVVKGWMVEPVIDAEEAYEPMLAEQALPIGTTLSGDQFTITGHLGAGGFGITYRAMDNVLGRTIVIKECFHEAFCYRNGMDVIPRNKAHAEPVRKMVTMFMREARALAKLRHPNIVGVHRAFEENETAYMAIDLIDGRDLFDILETHANHLSPARVQGILFQMLDAIEKVHEMDLLHRDISPDNIIIEKNGTPVLIDFGAARGDASRHTRAVSSLLVVKDGYSPQEFYVAGSKQYPCSDLYALAATFFHVISGESPASSQERMIQMSGNRPDPCAPLAGRIEGYDQDFLAAIDKAMSIHPQDRLQSAAQWRALIASSQVSEETTRKDTKVVPKDISLELEMSLTRLVEETNSEVRRISQLPPEPVDVVKPEPVSVSRPEWVEEFNAESLEPKPAAKDDFDDYDDFFEMPGIDDEIISPERAAVRKVTDDTNWVDRAVEKQERIRSQRLSEFAAFEARTSGNSAPPPPIHTEVGIPDNMIEGSPAPNVGVLTRYRSLGLFVGVIVCFCFVFLFERP